MPSNIPFLSTRSARIMYSVACGIATEIMACGQRQAAGKTQDALHANFYSCYSWQAGNAMDFMNNGAGSGREMNDKEQQIIDNLQPICQCKGIRKSVFLKYLKAGLSTVEELNKATGAGSGSCKGKRCTPRIVKLLGSKK
jgi:hypothetical protein